MTDEQLEATLRRFTPRDPDAGLRSRVLAAASETRVPLRPWDWALAGAAAALLVGAVMTDPHRAPVEETAAEAAWRAEVAQVADAMGGDDRARRLAESLVPRLEPAQPIVIDRGEEEQW